MSYNITTEKLSGTDVPWLTLPVFVPWAFIYMMGKCARHNDLWH